MLLANVFKHFEKNGEFFCFAGQLNQAVMGMFNLYRASQVLFQEENILEDAKSFSSKYLTKKRVANELLDKWIITKDLSGEVGYALDVPWYASLPRLETRFYLEQYGGENDVWIGKTLYRMPYVNNDVYLELAKLDYNYCQAMHYDEWEEIQSGKGGSQWHDEGNKSKREAELLVEIINLTAGNWTKDVHLNPEYNKLLDVTNIICTGLRNFQSIRLIMNTSFMLRSACLDRQSVFRVIVCDRRFGQNYILEL
ncbi:putative ent-copalyl diphosphate synthase [Medicago truncatula]|uniref:Putative ent-copalyl diphosphate synthase n=1 Tax=Medicago truncatula TaxID=3880 RepID=A0A396GSV5_MEDTR|nr:putative ent-copalyl diphosphate synthase [Medicago truncatula]